MSRIESTFDELGRSGDGAYIPYVCCGDRGIDFTVSLLRRLSEAGADVIELGLPFSDPLADGPTIQAAMTRSLASGFKVAHMFDVISRARSDGVRTPIVVMTYYNPVVRMGVQVFCKKLSDAGADGILPVDLPIEESGELDLAAEESNIDVIKLISPTTSEERARQILESAKGFAYAVSVSGVTGERDSIPSSAIVLLKKLRSIGDVPIALGFGISNEEHVRQALSAGASGVVEGSALINIYSGEAEGSGAALELVEKHARSMKDATRATNRE